MKVMISSDSQLAHYYIRVGLGRAFSAIGYDVTLWDIHNKPTFDAFDEIEPDIFIGQTYNVNDALVKCLQSRPRIKSIFKSSDWGTISDSLDRAKYPVLIANDNEVRMMKKLQEVYDISGLYVHYHENWVKDTHSHWEEEGFKTFSLLSGADIFEFTNGKFRPEFESDITFLGGYWGYKANTLNHYMIPLCNPHLNLNIKLFGNQAWPVSQYCGFLPAELTKDALVSAKICPNISEPHSQDLGYDIVERPYKLLSNKCFVISDYVQSMEEDVFTNDEIVFVKTPKEFHEAVKHYVRYPHERLPYIKRGYNTVLSGHTYFHRVTDILNQIGLPEEGVRCLQKLESVKEQLSL